MEDRKTALAVFLSLLVVLVYSEMYLRPATDVPSAPPSQSVVENGGTGPQQAESESPQTSGSAESVTRTERVTTPPATAGRIPSNEEILSSGIVEIESRLVQMKIGLLGGRLVSLRLKQFRSTLGSDEPLEIMPDEEEAKLPLVLHTTGQSDVSTAYNLIYSSQPAVDGKYVVPEGAELRIELSGALPDGTSLKKSFVIRDNSYLFEVGANFENLPPGADGAALEWSAFIPEDQAGSRYDPVGFLYLTIDKDVETLPVTEMGSEQEDLGTAHWVTLGDKYFMGALIAPEGPGTVVTRQTGRNFSMQLKLKGATPTFKVFGGPKEYGNLHQLGHDLNRAIDMGIFSFLALPLMQVLHIFYGLIGNYGLAIILLTLLIKVLFLPLTSASFKSMKAMQDLQPEIKALRERIKDPTQLNQEMMALYKKRGVNPMGGCLPMLIQIPVFFGLYMGLLNTIELRHADFALWITDLSAPEALQVFGVNVPVMILLMGLSMILQQWYTPSAMDPQQKKAMMAVPVIFTVMFIVFPFPAGLVLYWLINNLISIVQQGCLRTEKEISPFQATLVASVAIFFGGFVLTLI